MNARLLALSFVLALQVSCGVTQQRCSISTCSTGCCDSSGLCVAGNTQSACGSRGGTCSTCSFGFQCISGTCIGTGSGTGGGTSGFSGGVAGGGTAGGSSAGGTATAGGRTAGGSSGGGFVTAGGSATAGGSSGGGFVTAGGTVTAGGSSGGGFVTAGGVATAGGSSGGGFVSAGGTASAGGSAGGGTAATCANCPGCCLNGVCQPGNTTGFCGARGVACFACSTNQFCSNGQCTGANTGDTGATCAFDADCKEAILGGATRECVPPYRPDGGASGWPGGYCSNSGCDSFVDCPGTTGSCGRDGNCYATCLGVGLGQSNCRPGYVCSDALTVDGGTFALCVPDCRNPGYAGCGFGRTCGLLGYCN